MKRIISERFLWLSLKEVAFTEVGCVSNKEIEHFPRHLNQLFLGISIGKLQKTKVRKFSHTFHGGRTQPAITCSKLTIETLEQRCEICSKLTVIAVTADVDY